MVRTRSFIILPFFIAAGLIFADACTTYVRVPAVCPNDSYCLRNGDAGTDVARRAEFSRRAASATVTVTASRYVPNHGLTTVSGAGVVIGVHGYVLTAYHLVEGAESITVSLRNSTDDATHAVPMTPLVLSREKDAALLVPPRSELMPHGMPARYDRTIVGDEICFLGIGDRLRCGRVTETNIQSGYAHGSAATDIRLLPGDQGGPVMNVCGELVGIMLYDEQKKHRSIFIPLDDVMRTLGITPSDLR